MRIIEIRRRLYIEQNKKLNKVYTKFEKLLIELRKKDIPYEIASSINNSIEQINSNLDSEQKLIKLIKKIQSIIIKLIERELKLVPKNYYQNTWLVLGMTIFGVPFGVAFGSILDNMGLLGIGIPIGMGIGILIGMSMDKKAFKEGRQLDLEI